MFTPEQAYAIAMELQLPFEGFNAADLAEGMNVELEHGTAGGARTDVTHDDPYLTAQIAAAHLYERPDYYILLRDLEEAPPRRNPAADGPTRRVIETIDSTQPGAFQPSVTVWIMDVPTARPRRGKRGFAYGWSLMVGTSRDDFEMEWATRPGHPQPFLRISQPDSVTARWSRTRWEWHDGRWIYPRTMELAGEEPYAKFHAPWGAPERLEGDFWAIPMPEFITLEQEYLRVLPLIIEAFR